ncbi:MAG: type II toxin-antitoxin system VapC family toxin [Candidatus Rokubacteria bacterium]|nr:type II toxin-antitoxin system VapC family toxin [Candidatus Rokubacteria bacterium]
MPKVRATLEAAEAGRSAVYMSLINLGEVLYIAERERGLLHAHQVLAAVDGLPLAILPVTRPAVLAAAHVKARFALSYADAFAVVAARDHDAVILTGDREFAPVVRAGGVMVEWLPRR